MAGLHAAGVALAGARPTYDVLNVGSHPWDSFWPLQGRAVKLCDPLQTRLQWHRSHIAARCWFMVRDHHQQALSAIQHTVAHLPGLATAADDRAIERVASDLATDEIS